MRQHRAPPVHRLEQKEIREGLRSAICCCPSPQPDFFNTLLQTSEDIVEKTENPFGRANVHDWRNMVAIEDDLAVYNLLHMPDGQTDPAIGLLAGYAVSEIENCRLNHF